MDPRARDRPRAVERRQQAVAHLGVLRVLREMGVIVDAVAGTSGGAVAGAGFACGVDEAEMLARLHVLARSLGIRASTSTCSPGPGSPRACASAISSTPCYGRRTFADTAIPLWLVATDLASGAEVVIDSGPIADGVRASMSMPVFFTPWPRGDRLLIDGAVVNPLPASVLRDAGIRRIIGSNVAGQDMRVELSPRAPVPDVLQIVARMMNAMEREMLKVQVPLVDVMVRPRVNTGTASTSAAWPSSSTRACAQRGGRRGGAGGDGVVSRRNELLNSLAQVPLFSACSKRDLGIVARHTEVLEVAPGTAVTEEGALGDAFFVVLDGEASVRRRGRVVSRLGTGAWFGELAVLDPAPRNATIVAETTR